MNSSTFWEAFNQEPKQWSPIPINAWDPPPMPKHKDYASDFQGFVRDVLGRDIWKQQAQIAQRLAKLDLSKVRIRTPLEQYTAEKLWFRRWWERMGLPMWKGEPPKWKLSSYSLAGIVHRPIPREPGPKLLDWTIHRRLARN